VTGNGAGNEGSLARIAGKNTCDGMQRGFPMSRWALDFEKTKNDTASLSISKGDGDLTGLTPVVMNLSATGNRLFARNRIGSLFHAAAK
jgi:hypothetical protein